MSTSVLGRQLTATIPAIAMTIDEIFFFEPRLPPTALVFQDASILHICNIYFGGCLKVPLLQPGLGGRLRRGREK